MDGVDEAARRAGTYQGPGPSARARRKGRQRQAGDHRRAVRGVEGCHRWLHADRGEGPGPGGGALVGLSHLGGGRRGGRSEEHTSELQSLAYLVCRLLLEKKKKKKTKCKHYTEQQDVDIRASRR